MRRARYLTAAERNFRELYRYVAEESGDPNVARAAAHRLRQQCAKLAELPGILGRARPDLGIDIRSFPFRGYVVIFRYLTDGIEVIAVLHGHRDVIAYFGDDADE